MFEVDGRDAFPTPTTRADSFWAAFRVAQVPVPLTRRQSTTLLVCNAGKKKKKKKKKGKG